MGVIPKISDRDIDPKSRVLIIRTPTEKEIDIETATSSKGGVYLVL